MKFRELLEGTDTFFKYVMKDYVAIAKIQKSGKDHLILTFKGDEGSKNAYNEIFKYIVDNKLQKQYHLTRQSGHKVEILAGDYT